MSTQQKNYNLSSIDLSSNTDTSTNKYFNNFFDPTFTVDPNIDAAVISYFETVSSNKESAKLLASAVVYTSYTRGINPMSVLAEFAKLQPGELNQYLTLFLNLQRVGTSFLGLTTQPVTNKYVARAVLA